MGIHSNTYNGLPTHFGHPAHIGHVDFWPDGGNEHPKCENGKWACDHSMAHELYFESIKHKSSFLAYRCRNFESYKRGSCFNCRTKTNKLELNNRCRFMGYHATPLLGKPRKSDFFFAYNR